jgi:hypothetical protein
MTAPLHLHRTARLGKPISVSSEQARRTRGTRSQPRAVDAFGWLTDIDKMPIEDTRVAWPEALSPYVTVARIGVPPQPAWSEARAAVVDDKMSFSPWHGLAAHRPRGGIMRSRKPAYEMSAGFPARHNGCPMHEPGAWTGYPTGPPP